MEISSYFLLKSRFLDTNLTGISEQSIGRWQRWQVAYGLAQAEKHAGKIEA